MSIEILRPQETTAVTGSNARQLLVQDAFTTSAEKDESPKYTNLSDFLPESVAKSAFGGQVNEWINDLEYKRFRSSELEEINERRRVSNISLNPQDLLEFFDTNLEKLDLDGDGAVTTRELGKSKVGGDLADALWLYGKDIQKLSNDDFGFERSGITRSDMEGLVTNWGSGETLDLVEKINYVGYGRLDNRGRGGPSFTAYQHGLVKSWAKGGVFTGLALGGLGGFALADLTGGALIPAIPDGCYLGWTLRGEGR